MKTCFRLNDQITSPYINLVLEDGEFRSSVSIQFALTRSQELGLDLVEVTEGTNGKLPVCKIMDYGKLKYTQSKQKKPGKKETLKTIKFGFNISEHDMKIKNNKVISLLNKRCKVSYVLELKGREVSKKDEAIAKLEGNLELFRGKASWKEINKSDKSVGVVLNPL